MVTTEEHLSKRGDCIIAVRSEKGLADLLPELKEKIRNDKAEITFTMETGDQRLIVRGQGHHELTLGDPSDMVIRKSNFICDRTLMIGADTVSIDIPPELIQHIVSHESEVHITISACCDTESLNS
jgi:hypothetical protein